MPANYILLQELPGIPKGTTYNGEGRIVKCDIAKMRDRQGLTLMLPVRWLSNTEWFLKVESKKG